MTQLHSRVSRVEKFSGVLHHDRLWLAATDRPTVLTNVRAPVLALNRKDGNTSCVHGGVKKLPVGVAQLSPLAIRL